MICPKCGMKMNKKEYCFHCGYMENGNTINTKKIVPSSMLELYFGNHYDKYIRNQNWLIVGITGPVYIFCHGYYIIGLLLILCDYCISLFFLIFNHALLYYYVVLLLNIVYILFNRILWATVGNIIYLKLLTKKLKKIEKKDNTYYNKEIINFYQKDNKFIVLKYMIFGMIFLFLFYIIKNAIYTELGLL